VPGSSRVAVHKSAEVPAYFASTYVDDLEDTRCALHISSVFDVSKPAGRTTAARFEAVYTAMFDGYSRYFTQPQ